MATLQKNRIKLISFAIVGITSAAFLLRRKWDNIPEVYNVSFYILVLLALSALVVLKIKKDKQQGQFEFKKQGISIIFIVGTIIYFIVQEFKSL
ncbi:hypothetical protein FMM05_10960 [Flavobacterium zepuense]|uniref:Uncharacterized protein n=1 Tax=Flavobacterium zepuense TaxID=2593302 RepID=A0A552V1I5_9FLAO|nr:hypothetical protein [Flavobacterium zepuense]TRW24343.1 hypothetical protein FMM05_10960 [Flavobacterium zepuense]